MGLFLDVLITKTTLIGRGTVSFYFTTALGDNMMLGTARARYKTILSLTTTALQKNHNAICNNAAIFSIEPLPSLLHLPVARTSGSK